MADATDLKSVGDKHREGSSPSSSTKFKWVCGEAGESQQTVNLLPLVELVRIHPHPPLI